MSLDLSHGTLSIATQNPSVTGQSGEDTAPSTDDRGSQPSRRVAGRNDARRPADPEQDSLVRALKANEPGAFDRLVATYHERLCAVARTYVRDEADVSDIVQEAYVQAFKNIDRFEGHAQLGTWLHRITVNAALMLLRARRRRRELPIIEDAAGLMHLERRMAAGRSPATSLEDAEELHAAYRRTIDDIADLPATYRRIVHLRDIEERSNGDVAHDLGITRAAAKSKLLRAHRRLRAIAAARAGQN